ncbi:MAG: hypothetical protein LUC37_00675 [Prevotella sp.]|nr:hypothetical protein [Prevotella sp.]
MNKGFLSILALLCVAILGSMPTKDKYALYDDCGLFHGDIGFFVVAMPNS